MFGHNINISEIYFDRLDRWSNRESKLITVFYSPIDNIYDKDTDKDDMYVHSQNDAQHEKGFHTFLEKFLGMELPIVATTDSTDRKLYLQLIFSGMFIEQKRGWADFFSAMPYLGIKDSKKRIIVKNIEGGMLLDEYIASLQEEYDNLYSTEPKVADNYEKIEEELRLTEEAIATLEQQKREVHQKFMAENLAISKLNANLGTIRVDISNNKDAKKLRDLGAEIDSLSLKDICPVCHQKIQDALSARWNKYLEDREKVPKNKFSSDDDAKITTLRNVFIKNLRKFGYKSLTTMEQIEISKDSYLPVRENFDMKFDSSASDGIRAIWAFTLALMQTSI